MANNTQNTAMKPKTTKSKAPKKARKNKLRKKHPKLYAAFVVLFCIFVSGMLTAFIVGSHVLSYVDNFVNGDIAIDLDNYKSSQSQTSIIYAYDQNKKPVEQYRLHGQENRLWVSYEKMPKNLLWAFVCLEDKRFYEHNGVDWKRTIGVLIKPSLGGQGGSTITQQLIKNLTDQKQVTYVRKFNEILRALNLEKNYNKKEILEAYLNTVYLGAGCYGVRTAAETYFGKEVQDLTLVECAMLAAITKAPYTLNPYVNYEGASERTIDCLYFMHEQGKITDKQYNKALKTKLKVKEQKQQTSQSSIASDEILSWYEEYMIDQIISDLQAKYGYEYNEAWQKVYYGGLKIYSAVDLDVQKKLENIFATRKGFPYSRTDDYGRLPQAAMTIMDYKGRIVAVCGGTGEKKENRSYNRATDQRAKRQPGSSIKPLTVYAPAIEEGLIEPNSTILEKSIIVDGKPWPRNFNGDHGSGSYITVKEALVRSLNTVPVRILSEMLSVKTSLQYANESFHLNLADSNMNLSSLGVGGTNTGVTTLEMAAAFATFGNGGRYYKPYSYYKVVDRNGDTILDNSKVEPQRAISTATASKVLSMLTSAVSQSNGTGYGSAISRFQTFAKTGTTSDNCDKWYCGGTPHYVCSVWYGYDYRADLHTGSSNPAKTIFRQVFSELHSGLKSKTFNDVLVEVGASDSEIKESNSTKYSITVPKTTQKPNDDEEETTAKKQEEEKTTAKKPEENKTTTKKPQESKTTTKKQEENKTTTKKPASQAETTTKKPQESKTTTKKQEENKTTTKKPASQAETTTKKPTNPTQEAED